MIEALDSPLDTKRRRDVHVRRLGRMAYPEAMAVQDALLAEVIDRPEEPGALLVLEHDPVYTLGRGADEADLMGAPARLGVPVFRVGRGGGVTFHGPGQIVIYPVVRLPGNGRNVERFIRSLERAMVAACARFSVAARSVDGQTGVWTETGKIGAIGIGVKRGVAFHGLALNVSNRVDYFESVVPCRVPGMVVTTIEREKGGAVVFEEVAEALIDEVCRELELNPVACDRG